MRAVRWWSGRDGAETRVTRDEAIGGASGRYAGAMAWEPAVRQSITDMMQPAVKAGFYQNMPDNKIIYAP